MDYLKLGKYFILLILVAGFLVNVSIADVPTIHDPGIDPIGQSTEAASIKAAICSIVSIVRTVMGAVMLILIVMAAIVYAAGQVMGAETRARANVWATTMFLGAIMGGLIYLVVPVFINTLGIGGVTNVDAECSAP